MLSGRKSKAIELGCLLRSQRERLGLSISDAARSSGLPAALLEDIETGKAVNVCFYDVHRLIYLYGVALYDVALILYKK